MGKNKYFQILCKACKVYKVIVHDYCLMNNHCRMLLETKHENLSLMMRQVNSYYAM
ncbi:MAG: transposase [Sulfurimonadaceae bacterium]